MTVQRESYCIARCESQVLVDVSTILQSQLFSPGNCAMKEVGRSGYKQGKPERVLLPVNEKPGYNNLGQWKGIQNKSRVEPNWLGCRWLRVSSYGTCPAKDGSKTQLCLQFLFFAGRKSNRETLWGLATPLGVTCNNWAVPRTTKQTKSQSNTRARDLCIKFVLLSGLPELIRKLPWHFEGLVGDWDQIVLWMRHWLLSIVRSRERSNHQQPLLRNLEKLPRFQKLKFFHAELVGSLNFVSYMRDVWETSHTCKSEGAGCDQILLW